MTEEQALEVLREVAMCASRWSRDARLVGNVKAGDILQACVLAMDTINSLHYEISELGGAR